MSEENHKLIHLYNRAGFGLSPNGFLSAQKRGLEGEVERMMKHAIEEREIKVLEESPFAKYRDQMGNGRNGAMRQKVQKEVRESRAKIRDMNIQWMDQLVDSSTFIREKMTLFWHDHFGVRNLVGYYAQEHNNTLRKHALGKYGDLLMAVTKDPAMLQFLNNQQNVKRKPNENYARELLELFTLGRGHYSEQDIKGAARAFTGWGHDRFSGEFRFRRFQHDEDTKAFMGKSGNLDGDDILNILLENRQTSHFLAAKLYQYYVSDTPDEGIIDLMAKRLFKTDYNMGDLLQYVFESDWYYEDRFVNSKIKSPVELINGMRVQLGLSFGQPLAMLYLQRVLGQVVFYPPSVNGWSVGKEWIDHSSLMSRMSIPKALASGSELAMKPKSDGDDNNPLNRGGGRLMRTVGMDFDALNQLDWIDSDPAAMIESLSNFLVNRSLDPKTISAMVAELAKKSDVAQRLKWTATTIAGLPEYQMN